MSSTVGLIESAKSGLYAAQMGLQVTSQNIANADTVGYTRQSINQSAISPDVGSYRFLTTAQKIGKGVSVDSIYQIRNTFLDSRYRQSNTQYNLYQGMKSQLEQIEDIFNEFSDSTTTDSSISGLSGLLDNVGLALEEYLNTTSDSSLSSLMETAADSLTSTINTNANFLDQTLSNELSELSIYVNGGAGDTSSSSDVSGIDGIIENIQTLNEQIQTYEITGQKANELRDTRNTLLDELSSYIDITSTESEDGMVTVQLQSDCDNVTGKYIIDSQNVANEFNLSTNTNATTGQEYTVLTWGKTLKSDGTQDDTDMYGGEIADIEAGIVKSYLNVINGDGTGVDDPTTGKCGCLGIAYLKQKLNDYATAFADIINTQYQNSLEDPTTYSPLIEIDSTDPAGTISLSTAWRATPELFVEGIADSEENLSDYLQSVYDALFTDTGSISITSLDGSGSSIYSGSLSKFADSFQTEISSTISVISGKSDSYYTSASNLDDQRQSISSVSINDEGVNLIKYQQAYNASARIITTLDEMLDKIINGTGTVGL